ncbi:MAG: hypothetical protein OXI81_06695 [Paracoccaceae bacterium]|nr:hypothetical protein [Paracoccaceae bacterium]
MKRFNRRKTTKECERGFVVLCITDGIEFRPAALLNYGADRREWVPEMDWVPERVAVNLSMTVVLAVR